jgi:hypothetical protein
MSAFVNNYLYELPDDIQVLIYKNVFKCSLKNISDKRKAINNFNKLVVIRKVKNLNPDQLEGVINQIELALSQKNYQEAMNKSLSLDKAYFPIVQKFLEELSIAIEIQNADKEIIKYLKSLT